MKKRLFIFLFIIVNVFITQALAEEYASGDYRESLTVDGRKRSYLLHIPKNYSDKKRYPLVLVFHGGAGTGEKVSRQTGFTKYADKEGFIAVYPDGIEYNWNDGRGTTDAERLGVNDVKFVRTLIEHLKTAKGLAIDSNRIYATGVSNGAIFSHRLGCEMSDVFAAIGPVIGSMATNMISRCNPSEPISVVAIQGTGDPFISIKGGEVKHKRLGIGDGGLVESADKTMRFWTAKNGCEDSPKKVRLPVIIDDRTEVEKISYSQCKNKSAVVYYIVKGMGHIWPPRIHQDRVCQVPVQKI